MKFSKTPILLSLLLATALVHPVCAMEKKALLDGDDQPNVTPQRPALQSSKVANEQATKAADPLLLPPNLSINSDVRHNSNASDYGTTSGLSRITIPNLESIENIRAEAAKLARLEIFSQNAITRSAEVKTSIQKILKAYEDFNQLAAAASGQQGGIKKAIPQKMFATLKKQERALRKVISLIWGGLMLKDAQDIETFKGAKSAPFLFNGKGFEGVSADERQPKTYSFSDAGNTDIHVAQIKAILEEVGYNLETEISLPFHPIETPTRKKMAKQYHEAHQQEPAENLYGFMFGYFKDKPVLVKEQPRTMSPIPSQLDTTSIHSTSTKGSLLNVSFSDHGPQIITEDALMNAANHQKFMAIVNSKFRKGNPAYDLILKINNRLDPSESSEDKFNNPTFNDIAFGTTLKPITTAAYRSKDYTHASKALQEYWDKTEEILQKAERVIREDSPAANRLKINEIAQYNLNDRAERLIAGILWKIQTMAQGKSGDRLSTLTKKALQNLQVPKSEDLSPYNGPLLGLKEDLGSTYHCPLDEKNSDIRLNILSELTTELEKPLK